MAEATDQYVPPVSMGSVIDPVTFREIAIPVGATAELAIRRAVRDRAGQISSLRLWPDHGFEWPLWDANRGFTAYPSYYHLSDDLIHDLREWTSNWHGQIGVNLEWDSPESRDRWRARGEEIVQRLANEAWWYADVFAIFRDY